ncbi:MAG: hypothetical protein KDK62_06785 [Chlamydiia bacterium]|nr:hypothetical protein [Chlamydiia bacterium]
MRVDLSHYGFPTGYQPDSDPTPKPIRPKNPGKPDIPPPKTKKAKSEGALTHGWLDWFQRILGIDTVQKAPVKEEKLDPIEQDRVNRHLQSLRRIEAHRQDLLDEAFDPMRLATEAGLEKAWIQAQIAQIELRKDENTFNDEEMVRVQEVIQRIKAKLEEKMNERLKEAQNTGFFSKASIASSAMFIATTLVVGAVGVYTGGTVPAVLLVAQGIAAGASGSMEITQRLFRYRTDSLSAEVLGNKEQRRVQYDRLHTLIDQKKQASDAVRNGYNLAHKFEKERNSTIQGIIG